MKTYLITATIPFVCACSPVQVVSTGTHDPVAASTLLPTNAAAPSPTSSISFDARAEQPVPTSAPTAVAPVVFVRSTTAGPDPFCLPADLAYDLQGNFYVVDACNRRIVKFDAEGNFLATWGREGMKEGEFEFVDLLGGCRAWCGGSASRQSDPGPGSERGTPREYVDRGVLELYGRIGCLMTDRRQA